MMKNKILNFFFYNFFNNIIKICINFIYKFYIKYLIIKEYSNNIIKKYFNFMFHNYSRNFLLRVFYLISVSNEI